MSGPEYDGALQDAIPEVASEPEATSATGLLNQPFASGARERPAETDGAVASNLTVNAAVAVFPAASVQLPPSGVPAVSGPGYVAGAEHDTIPEAASDPPNVTVTASRYQPASRSGTAVVAGGVASYLSVARGAAVFPARSVHEPPTFCAMPSGPEKRAPAQPASPDVASEPVTVTSTGPVYQPFTSGPRASATVATGGVAS